MKLEASSLQLLWQIAAVIRPPLEKKSLNYQPHPVGAARKKGVQEEAGGPYSIIVENLRLTAASF